METSAKISSSGDHNFPEKFRCPISGKFMSSPVIDIHGNTHDQTAKPNRENQYTPNARLRIEIKKWLAQDPDREKNFYVKPAFQRLSTFSDISHAFACICECQTSSEADELLTELKASIFGKPSLLYNVKQCDVAKVLARKDLSVQGVEIAFGLLFRVYPPFKSSGHFGHGQLLNLGKAYKCKNPHFQKALLSLIYDLVVRANLTACVKAQNDNMATRPEDTNAIVMVGSAFGLIEALVSYIWPSPPFFEMHNQQLLFEVLTTLCTITGNCKRIARAGGVQAILNLLGENRLIAAASEVEYMKSAHIFEAALCVFAKLCKTEVGRQAAVCKLSDLRALHYFVLLYYPNVSSDASYHTFGGGVNLKMHNMSHDASY